MLLASAVWLAAGCGHVPPYGDTRAILALAERGGSHPLRGWLYPRFVAGLARVLDRPGLVGAVEPDALAALAGFAPLQGAQGILLAAALWYFLRVVAGVPPLRALAAQRRRGLAAAALFGLLLLDPVVAHYQLAVLTDAMALAACLVACAAATELVVRRPLPARACVLLVVGVVAASALRIEKGVVLLLGFAIAAAWIALGRRTLLRPTGLDLRGVAALLLLAMGGVGLAMILARAQGVETGETDLRAALLHQRVVHRHLEEVYEALPADVRQRLTRDDARAIDGHLVVSRRALRHATGGDPEATARLVEQLAATVWSERAGAIVADMLADGVEHLFPTVSFAIRLVRAEPMAAIGQLEVGDPTDNTGRIYARMRFHRPRSTPWVLAAAVALQLACLVLAGAEVARRRPTAREVLPWIPSLAVCAVNAAVFSATQNLVQIRYDLLAHVVFLTLVYRAALARMGLAVTPAQRGFWTPRGRSRSLDA